MRLISLPAGIIFCFPGMFTYGQDKTVMTVSQDGKGDFTSIQAAVHASKAFPDSRITIYIRNGIYNEKVLVPSCNTRLSFVGESAEGTIITYGDFFGKKDRGRNSRQYFSECLIEGTTGFISGSSVA